MDVIKVLQVIVLLVTIATGIFAFIKPKSITGFIGLKYDGVRGISELRAIFGGLLIGIGLAPLLLNTTEAYQVAGIAYLAIAVTRTISVLVDKSYDQSNLVSVVIEWVSGIILML